MRRVLVLVFLLGVAVFASADTLVLSPVTVNHQYQQTTNNPCVIGDSSCQQPAGMAMTLFPSGASSYDAYSPTYTVAQLMAIVGNSFVIGVDVNQTSVTQTLTSFSMLVNGTVRDSYIANPATLVPPTAGGGNGNGYADYILSNFTSLSGLAPTDEIRFHVVMPLVNDGREEFFLISTSTPAPTPEPATLFMLGTGVLVAGNTMRRKLLR